MAGAVRPQVAIDFDGVLNDHATGFINPGVVTDPPTPGALDWMTELVKDMQVIVFSARAESTEGIEAIVGWMNANGFGQLPYTITSTKPPFALWYIDDRGYNFDGAYFPSAEELLAIHPWWQTSSSDDELPPVTGDTTEALAASLADRAATEAPRVQDTVERAVRAAGGSLDGLESQLKGASALAGKIRTVMREMGADAPTAAANVKDGLRYTALFDTEGYTDGVLAVLDLLQRGAGLQLSRLRNYWLPDANPNYTDGAYVGVNAVLRGLDGYQFELQFHTPQSLNARDINLPFFRELRSGDADPGDARSMISTMQQNNGFVPRPDGVEKLTDGLTLLAAGIPASVHYRRASSGGHSCGNCSYYSTGTVGMCGMFDVLVKPSYVCDKWAKGQDAMPGQEKWHPERGTIAASAVSDAAEAANDLLMEQIAYVAAEHKPNGGYGNCWWSRDTGQVFWVCADWTSNDEVADAITAFKKLRGVLDVDACAECGNPTGDGWQQVYPEARIYDQEAITAALPRRTNPPVVPVSTHNRILKQGYKKADELEPKLAAIIKPILDKAVDDAARKFLAKATDHLTAALVATADISSRSTMVCVMPRTAEAEAIAAAHPGGEDPAGLHVTLAYLGELGPDDTDKIIRALAPVAGTHPPLEGHVGGVGAFGDNGNGVPAIGLPDVRGLTELRQAVAHAITAAPNVDYQRSHGFTPHITVAYRDGHSAPAARKIIGQPLHFDAVHIVQGDRIVASHPLTGTPSITAAGAPAGPPGWTPPAPDELVNVPALTNEILAKTEPVRKGFLEAMMTPALKEAGLNFDITNPLTAKALTTSAQHVTSIAETTRENIRKSIAAGYQTGLSIPDTAKLIRAGASSMNNVRATMIARTELAGATNGGSLAATQIIAQETGAAYTKTWITAPGALYPRHEDYNDLDGQTVGLDEVFQVGDSELQYPGDPSGDPGEVINCRCSMTYTTPEGEESSDAENTPDLTAEDGSGLASEGEAGAEGGPDLMEGGGGAEPIALPTNRFAAADQMMAGLVESTSRAGKLPEDAAQLAQGKANWEKRFRGNIETDKAHLGAVKDADAYNLTSDVHQAQVAKYGQDAAIVVRPVSTNNPLYIKPGQAAYRMTTNRVTLISSDPLNFTGIRELPQPGDATTGARGGLSATLRHEYAHQIYEGLTAEQRSSFLDALPDSEQAKTDLTLYASTSPEEAFSELYAVVSDPNYDPSAWPDWVRTLGHEQFGAPLTKGGASTVAPVVRAIIPAAPAGTGTLAADIAKLKASIAWQTDRQALEEKGYVGVDPYHGLAQVGLIEASPLAQEQMQVAIQAGARVRQEMTIDPQLAHAVTDAEAKVEVAKAEREALVASKNEEVRAARKAWTEAEDAAFDRAAMAEYGKPYAELLYQQKAEVQLKVDDAESKALAQAYYDKLDAFTEWTRGPSPVKEANAALRTARSAQAVNLRDEAMRALGEVRSMGSTADTKVEWGKTSSKAGPKMRQAQERLTAAQANLPTDWIAGLRPVDAGYAGRGYEQDFGVGHKIRISDRTSVIESDPNGQQVALHELGHAVEATNPMVQQQEQAFYQWRTRGGSFTADQEKARKLKVLQPGSSYSAKEIAREDKFADPYMGKDYTRGGRTMNFELLTMGLESLFNGSEILDEEYTNWLLGVLALA